MKITDSAAFVPIAVRAYTEPASPPPNKARKTSRARPGAHPTDILVIDTETTTDEVQRLRFGFWRHARVNPDGTLTYLAEGIVYGDDLPALDPPGFETLRAYAADHAANVDRRNYESDPVLGFASRAEFMYDTFRKLAWKANAHVVMFNKPFDLSRLAEGYSVARVKDMKGGFTLRTAAQSRRWYDPNVRVFHIDSTKAKASFASPKKPDQPYVSGWFLDLRTWVWALTNRKHTLASACEAFGVEHGKLSTDEHGGPLTEQYIEYARRDVLATAELFEKLYAEHRRHPVDLPPTQAFSAASLAKAYLTTMGFTPLAKRCPLPQEIMGAAMSAFYGGRAECRIRRTPVPVELVDFTSMYPTVNALMRLWSCYTADRIDIADATDDVRTFLESVTADDMFDPASWPQLVGIAQIVPDGDILPVRAQYGSENAFTIGVNPLTSDTPLWYTIPDLVAAKILTGKAPYIVKAYRFTPARVVDGLTPVALRGVVDIDPACDDFFTRVIEERARLKTTDPQTADFLKVLANAGSYGIFAQLTPEPGERDVVVYDHGSPRAMRGVRYEKPGAYFYPPVAACITGAARLMLALAEHQVTRSGGCWAFCDTDSLAIVATDDGRVIPCPGGDETTPDGGPGVRSLTHAQVAEIKQWFAGLSPYGNVPDLLKTEAGGVGDPMWCYAISAKRYALYRADETTRTVRIHETKWSEHGLGHLRDPRDNRMETPGKEWIREWWRAVVTATHFGGKPELPEWVDRPAVGQFAATTPDLLHRFDALGAGKPYADRIKPFNFVLTLAGRRRNADGRIERISLVAPYSPDPATWLDLPWRSTRDGTPYRPVPGIHHASSPLAADQVAVKTYGNVLAEHERHPEAKFAGPDGAPCGPGTAGLLARRPTVAAIVQTIGKEANKIEEMEAGVVTETPQTDYTDPRAVLALALRVLAPLSSAEVAARISKRIRLWTPPGAGRRAPGVPERPPVEPSVIRRIRRGTRPGPWLADALAAVAARVAEDALGQTHPDRAGEWRILARTNPAGLLAAHLALAPPRVCACGCGAAVAGRSRYAASACRKRIARRQAESMSLSGG